ncbi:hypothetical protein BGZ76_008701 [Entomortierella beljakovae]|nr:hypothetical protein BGZ76_008701 [Entomortierella beljakovae]
MPALSAEIEEVTPSITSHEPQQQLKQKTSAITSTSVQSYPSTIEQNQQQDYQAISPEIVFSDEQYDSDLEAEAELDLGPSRETLQEGQIVKSGYMHKKGERIKMWKKKWFVLRTSKLAYYKDNKEYELLRIIDIRDIHKAAQVVVKNKTGVFVILTPRRTFTLQAESTAEMEEWVQAINQTKVQFDLGSSSDIESTFSGSNTPLEHISSALHPGTPASRRLEMTKQQPQQPQQQGPGILLPRKQSNQLSLSDPGLLASNEYTAQSGMNLSPPHSSTLAPRASDSNISELSMGIMSQSMGQIPSPNSPNTVDNRNNTSANTNANRPLQSNMGVDGLSSVTAGTQAIHIGSPPRTYAKQDMSIGDIPPNSFSSNHSFNTTPGTPNSPEYGYGGDQFANVSSEEEDVVDDPTVLEAGRIAAAANAPGSGLVTGEQLESTVLVSADPWREGDDDDDDDDDKNKEEQEGYLEKEMEYQPLGIINLSTIIDSLQTDPVSKSKQYCLRIVTAKRSFVCCAPDEDTLLQWIDALHVECERVHREAKLEKELESERNRGELDESILEDPRAMGRIAHINTNNSVSPARHGPGNSGTVIQGAYTTSSSLNKALNLDATNQSNVPSASFTSSPPLSSAPSATSTNIQSPPSVLRSIHDESNTISRPTVTFSV